MPKSRAPKPLADTAIVTVLLDRKSGDVTIESELSTPMETWAMLDTAARICSEELAGKEA